MINRNHLTKDDIKVYAAVLEHPSAKLYPNASQWYQAVSSKLVVRYLTFLVFFLMKIQVFNFDLFLFFKLFHMELILNLNAILIIRNKNYSTGNYGNVVFLGKLSE